MAGKKPLQLDEIELYKKAQAKKAAAKAPEKADEPAGIDWRTGMASSSSHNHEVFGDFEVGLTSRPHASSTLRAQSTRKANLSFCFQPT